MTLRHAIRHGLRQSLYTLGALGLFHRVRNAHTLTTFMFHRVLPRQSAAFRDAEREYTFSCEGFAACLDFITRHYRVISLAELEAARTGGTPLPARAALITFDDGWLDTLEHAWPLLQQRRLPALLFVATEVLDQAQQRWWQDMLVSVLDVPAAAEQLARELGLPAQLCAQPGQQRSHRMAAAMAALSQDERLRMLGRHTPAQVQPRQMLTRADLGAHRFDGLTLAAHGHTHAPLTLAANPDMELRASLAAIRACGGSASMSFPHGAFNDALVAQAEQCGFGTIFTSVATLDAAAQARAFGRIHVPENEWTCGDDGRVSPAKLASFLFFRPIAGTGPA